MDPPQPAARYRWRLHPERPAPRDRLCQALGLGPVLAQVLVNRGLEDPGEARSFLDPHLSALPDPLELPGCQDGVSTLLRALERRTPILVHGDYDVDGACGAALLVRLLRLLDHPVSAWVPDRFQDGYSFGERSLRAIRERGARVVVAVDNGTTALEPLARLAAGGVEVVVVDHHPPGPELPSCAALVNPWVGHRDEDGGFPWYCGTGVAWLLAWALLRERHGEERLPPRERRFLVECLGLVALATVADVMPLRGPNRTLVRHGLRVLESGSLAGLRALLEVTRTGPRVRAEDLAFRLAPRLNAAGRLGRAEEAFQLLLADAPAEARRLALLLDDRNRERRELEARELERLAPLVEARLRRGDRALFAGHDEAHFGVLGIVSNRLMEETGRPTLLWAGCGPGLARGSARAPEGHDLRVLLEAAAPLFHGFGGHARAAGFHFDPEDAPAIEERLRQAAARLPDPAPPSLEVDMEVAPDDLDLAAVRELERLEPCGEGLAKPLFLASGLRLTAPPRPLGDGSHAELLLEGAGGSVRVLGWGMAERLLPLAPGTRLDVVFEAGISYFRGQQVEWTLRDLRPAADHPS